MKTKHIINIYTFDGYKLTNLMERITSLQNIKIKKLISLSKSNVRKEQQLFIVEGIKEISLAIDAGYRLHSLFWYPSESFKFIDLKKIPVSEDVVYEISSKIFAKIAYRENSGGLIGVFHQQNLSLENLKPSNNSLIVILESVEKPGNLGAILRTADAASVFAVLMCDPKTDVFNPNIIRSSVGCVFTNRIIACTNEEALKWIKQHNIKTFAAAILQDSKPYYFQDYKGPTAFVMGTEDKGLSDFWLKNCDEKIIIPMSGKIDSLNVSASAAILIFEAKRQRKYVSS